MYFWSSIYIFTVFTSSLPCPVVEVGAVATSIVVASVIVYGGGDGGLRGGVGWDIGRVIIDVLLGIDWGIRFYKVLYVKPCINILVSILDLKVLLDYSL